MLFKDFSGAYMERIVYSCLVVAAQAGLRGVGDQCMIGYLLQQTSLEWGSNYGESLFFLGEGKGLLKFK